MRKDRVVLLAVIIIKACSTDVSELPPCIRMVVYDFTAVCFLNRSLLLALSLSHTHAHPRTHADTYTHKNTHTHVHTFQ